MASWMDAPPTESEIRGGESWDSAPPSPSELGQESIMDRLRGGRGLLKKKVQDYETSPEYKAQREEQIKNQTEQARKYGQEGLNLLPAAGGVAGGMAGTAAGALVPLPGTAAAGGYAGAGAGSAAGEGLKYAGEKYLLGKDMSKEDLEKRMLVAGAAGVVGQGVGNMMGAVGKSFVGSGIKDVAPSLTSPGAEAISNAAANLKVKPTQGMLTDDYTARNLENSLSQSPSIPGSWIRKEQEPVTSAIKNTVEEAAKDQSHLTDVESGKELRKGVGEYWENRAKPIQDSYQEIEGKTKDIPLNSKGLKRISNNIRNLDEARFEGSEGHSISNQFADWLEQAKDANDLKILKTKAGNILRDNNASYEAKSAAAAISGKLEQAQSNSVMRQAISKARQEAPQVDVTTPKYAPPATEAFPFLKPAREAAEEEASTLAQGASDIAKNKELMGAAEEQGKVSGRQLIGKIKETNKNYRGLIQDAQTFGKGSGLTKANKGMSATLADIESASPEEMSTALFDQGNSEFTSFVKEKMPQQFELARQQKIAQIVHKTGGDPNKILKLTEKMSPESKVLLFGEENVKNLGDANVLKNAIPAKVGASDTPRGLQFRDIMSPTQNVVDLGRYGLLKGKKNLPKAGLMLQKAAPYGQGLVNKGLIDERED